jgi:WD40 repeat protein
MDDASRSTHPASGGARHPQSRRPFVGTRPFSAAEADFFFGREDEAVRLANLIIASTLTVLYGDSGVGKSSLINARLPQALEAIDPDWLLIPFFEWQVDCLQRLEKTIERATDNKPIAEGGLSGSLLRFADNKDRPRPILLILDQFEEYFLYYPQGLSALDAELAKLINRRVSPVRILFSLRNDGLFLLDRLRLRIPHIFGSMMPIEPLDKEAAIDCVTHPLEAYNKFAGKTVVQVPERRSALVQALVNGAAEDRILSRLPGRGRSEMEKGGRPSTRIVAPFLQMALDALWEEDILKRRHRSLELATLRELANLSEQEESSQAVGAIAQQYVDSILHGFNKEEKEVCALIFERMVLPSGQKVAVKPADLRAVLADDRQKELALSVLAGLSDDQTRRLIKRVAGPKDAEPHYQIVHDAMAIPLLGWIAQWKADEQMATARAEAEVEAARARAEAEEAAEHARKKTRKRVIVGMTAAGVIASIVIVGAFVWSYLEAQHEVDRVIASGLRPEQTRVYNLQKALGALSWRLGKPEEVWERLQQVYELYRFDAGDKGIQGQIHAADFAADSKSVIAIDLGGKLRQWALGPRHEVLREFVIGPRDVSGRPAEGRSLRVSPLGDVAAVGFNDGSVVLVDLKGDASRTHALQINGAKPHRPRGPGIVASVFGLAFSSDGSLLVSASRAGNIVIWQRDPSDDPGKISNNDPLRWSGRSVDLNKNRSADIWAVDIDREKQTIAVGLSDGRVCLLWLDEVDTARCNSQEQTKTVKSVKFMPDRPVLVSAGNDAKVTIWDVDASGRQLHPWPIALSQENAIWDLDFNRDGSLLATSSWDGSVRIYQTSVWRLLNTVAADKISTMIRRQGVTAGDSGDTSLALRTVRFDPTSTMLVTASLDHTARVWSPLFDRTSLMDLSYRLPPIGTGSIRAIRSVAIGSTGDRIAFTDGKAIYLRSSGEEPKPLPSAAADRPQASEFSRVLMPSENEVVASAVEPRLAVWSESGGEWRSRTLALPGDAIPDGRSMAIDGARSVLAVEVREGARPSILLCPLAEKEWTCAKPDNSALDRLSLAIDLKPDGCAYEAQVVITLSKSGRLIAAGAGYCLIEVFDRQNTNASARSYSPAENYNLTSIDFSPDDKAFVATASGLGSEVRLWNLTGGSSRNINHHVSPVPAARYSPSGRRVISISYDNTVVVSSSETGKKLVGLNYRNSLLSLDIASTPRGTLMATGSDAGEVNVMRFFEDDKDITSYAASVLRDVAQ